MIPVRPGGTRVAAKGGLVAVAIIASLAIWNSFIRPIELPAPREAAQPAAAVLADYVGADACSKCHAAEYAAWKGSTHGRAGGSPSRAQVVAPFDGRRIMFADASVTPRVRGSRGDIYEFVVQQTGEPTRTLRVDGVVGGGHIYGGGTQAFFTSHEDGTLRLLPFEWSRQGGTWFCNTNSRSGKGWAPITPALRIAECGDWPPVRVMGDNARFANCQSCHASQATLVLDTVARRYQTRFASLAINCESCHGPARRHVELAERGALSTTADIGFASLATLDKDASLRVCYQCHAVKDKLRDGFLSGAGPGGGALSDYYSTRFPLLGDRPLHPDGRIRTFAYQEGHQYSDCYLNGGMTCVSCHDPHDQRYQEVWGGPLQGRFSDKQCTSCHASKADNPTAHTRHDARQVTCVACHMPSRQEPETRALNAALGNAAPAVIPYTRSDHTISIPRPALDSSLGMRSACSACHRGMSIAIQDKAIRDWWGDVKPLDPIVAAQLRMTSSQRDATASSLLLGDAGTPAGDRHEFARFSGLSRYLEDYIRADVPIDDDVARRLTDLAVSSDADVRAAALAALHLAEGEARSVRRTLARSLRTQDGDAALRTRWALALGFMGDRFAGEGNVADALTAYTRALDVQPSNARLLLSLGNAQRDGGNPAAAVQSYRRSIDLDAADPLVWVNLGIALGALGDTASAIATFTRAAMLNPYEPLAWFNLGNILLVRGDLPRASAMYARTAALDPSIVLAHFQLARVSLLQNDGASALKHLKRGLAFDSSDASAREMAAELERRK